LESQAAGQFNCERREVGLAFVAEGVGARAGEARKTATALFWIDGPLTLNGIVAFGKERGPRGGSEMLVEHKSLAAGRCQSQGQRARVREGDEAREVGAYVLAEVAIRIGAGEVEPAEV